MMSALVDATVQGCQRGQDHKQQSVRCGVQSKVEESVDQHREATGQCSRGHAAPELVVRFEIMSPGVRPAICDSQPTISSLMLAARLLSSVLLRTLRRPATSARALQAIGRASYV